MCQLCFAQPVSLPHIAFDDNVAPKRETRAAWIATIGGIDWPHSYAQNTQRSIEKQQRELINTLDSLHAAGMNTVLLQTRVRATTIYPSATEPWDGCLSGKPGVNPGYDALQFAIDECHKRGMELHAWVVTIPVGKWDGLGCRQMRKRFPNLIKKIGADGYMNPEDSRTSSVLADLCGEIVSKYDVDGIHLDYIRYPEDWQLKVSKERGRQYITSIVRAIHSRVKGLKPWVRMSCSPIGKADDLPRQRSNGWNAYSRVCQDAQGWLRDGYMDMLFPMMYFKGNNFYPFALDWKQRSYGRIVVPGLGLYFMSPKEKNWPLQTITQEMEVLRQWGMGHCMYRSKFFTDDTKGIMQFTKEFNQTSSLPEAITWQSSVSPDAPSYLSVDSVNSVMEWGEAHDNSNGPYLTYNIYSSDEWPVDIDDARNLMLTRYVGTKLLVPLNGCYYAITAMDRYGNESAPLQMKCPYEPAIIHEAYFFGYGNPVFDCDGYVMHMNADVRKSDVLNIETLQGQSVRTIFPSKEINVAMLPEGVYQVRQLGKKKQSRLLGYFFLKRRKSL